MVRRTEDQWRELVEQHTNSGQTATAFCADNGINAKYFSLRKQKLAQEPKSKGANFVSIKVPSTPASSVEIKMGKILIRCPANRSAQWLAELVRALR